MNIDIHHRPPLRAWHVRLAAALRARGHVPRLRACGSAQPLPRAVAALLALEHRVFGPRPALFDPAPGPIVAPGLAGAEQPAELTIVCDGLPPAGGDCLAPLFCGRAGDAALLGLLSAAEPALDVVRHSSGGATPVLHAALAVEDRQIAARGLEQLLARVVSLLAAAVDRPASPEPVAEARPAGNLLAPMLAGLAAKVQDRLRPRSGPNHWRIAFRRVDEGGAGPGVWPPAGLRLLPEDGRRFYADPVPFAHEGRRYIFFEDFPYDTAKGVISRVEVDEEGRTSPPRVVLEQDFHLSYPFLLRHAGAIYMLPEMGAAGRLQLFRADPFPDRWVPDRVLIENCRAADATLIQYEGRWWLFATTFDDGGSTWDQLMLFHAPDLFGPWTPHARNPVLVDAGAARPAGGMWIEEGRLMRVAQDCRAGYGRGLAVCRVDRLDPDHFAQTLVARLGPFGAAADGTHTYVRADGLEVLDLRYPPGSSSRSGT